MVSKLAVEGDSSDSSLWTRVQTQYSSKSRAVACGRGRWSLWGELGDALKCISNMQLIGMGTLYTLQPISLQTTQPFLYISRTPAGERSIETFCALVRWWLARFVCTLVVHTFPSNYDSTEGPVTISPNGSHFSFTHGLVVAPQPYITLEHVCAPPDCTPIRRTVPRYLCQVTYLSHVQANPG